MIRLLCAAALVFSATSALADKSPKPMTEEDLQVVITDDTSAGGSHDILVPIAWVLMLAAIGS